ILVLNKADLLPEEPDAETLARRIMSSAGLSEEAEYAGALAISARTGQGFEGLLAKIDQSLTLDPVAACTFRIPAAEGAPLHLLHERAQVKSVEYEGDMCKVEALVPASVRRRLAAYTVPERDRRRYGSQAVPQIIV